MLAMISRKKWAFLYTEQSEESDCSAMFSCNGAITVKRKSWPDVNTVRNGVVLSKLI